MDFFKIPSLPHPPAFFPRPGSKPPDGEGEKFPLEIKAAGNAMFGPSPKPVQNCHPIIANAQVSPLLRRQALCVGYGEGAGG